MFKKYLMTVLAALMLASMAMVPNKTLAVGSGTNPPPNYGTLLVDEGTGTFPSTLDPANCYDTASAECIFNSMETVIFPLGERYDMFIPMLATQVTVAPPDTASPAYTNFTVYFKIRGVNPVDDSGTIPFQNRCRTDTPATWGNYNLTTVDVQYSWQRFLVRDFVGAATSTWYEPLLDTTASDPANLLWGQYINDAVQRNNTHVWINCANLGLATAHSSSWVPINMFLMDGGTFDPRFYSNIGNLPIDYPLRILFQVMSQPWSSITSKQWVLDYVNTNLPSIGGGLPAEWNGTFGTSSAGWQNYTKWAPDQSPFDRLPVGATTSGVMCGTGPYVLDSYDSATGWSSIIYDFVARAHLRYWGTFPARDFSPPYPSADPNIVSSGKYPAGYVRRLTIRQADTSTRIASLIAGTTDVADIPRNKVGELHMNGYMYAETLEGIRLNFPVPLLGVESMHYTFFVDNPGGANTYGKIYPNDTLAPDGIPANFFSNPHVRKAMTYLFNYRYNFVTLFNGEAYQPITCAPDGLQYVDPSNPWYGPDPYIDAAKAELNLATFGGEQLWIGGFTVPICYYDSPGGVREASCFDLKAMIEKLAWTYALPYHASTYLVDWPTFMQGIDAHLFAIFRAGWLGGHPDIDIGHYLFAYADSQGKWGAAQRFSDPAIDADLASAARTPDGPLRQALYYDAELRLYKDNPSVFIAVPMGREYQREWVQGMEVEYNALYPGVYARYVWKWLYMRGNVDYNRFCNICDISTVLDAFGSYIGKSGRLVIHAKWNFNCDIDGEPRDSSPAGDGGWRDRKIDMYDVYAAVNNFGRTEPSPGPWVPNLVGW